MNNYRHTVNAFCELYNMLCAIAIALLIAAFIPQIPIENIPNTIDSLVNCVVLLLLIVQFFHGNIVFVRKCHYDEKKSIPICMFIDLTFMLIQGLLLIAIALIGVEQVYYVVVSLVFSDSLWMGLTLCIKKHPCPKVKPYALRWMVSNLFTTCLNLFFILFLATKIKSRSAAP